MPPYDWANGGTANIFFGYGEYGLSTMGVDVILQNGCGIQR